MPEGIPSLSLDDNEEEFEERGEGEGAPLNHKKFEKKKKEKKRCTVSIYIDPVVFENLKTWVLEETLRRRKNAAPGQPVEKLTPGLVIEELVEKKLRLERNKQKREQEKG